MDQRAPGLAAVARSMSVALFIRTVADRRYSRWNQCRRAMRLSGEKENYYHG
jgi:hypothetical protein